MTNAFPKCGQNEMEKKERKERNKKSIFCSFAPSASIKQEQNDNLTIHPSLSILGLCVNLT